MKKGTAKDGSRVCFLRAFYGAVLRVMQSPLPAEVLLLLIGEAGPEFLSEGEKCSIWVKAGLLPIPKNLAIECSDVDLTNLGDLKYLAQFLGQVPKPCFCLSLSLVNFKYPDGVLQDSWFCTPDILSLNIISLTIQGGLTQIDADGLRCLPRLGTLILSGTNIRHLWKNPFHNVRNLRTLELHSNPFLTSADPDFLSALTRLQILRITSMDSDMQNFLRNLTRDGGREIETVDWSRSNLRMVPAEVVSRLPRLKVMDLQSSRIKTIGDGFNELTNLSVLILYNNEIRIVPETSRMLIERLSALYLRKNPLVCDCDMVWLQRYVNDKRNGTFGDFNEVVCSDPEELRNMPFLKAKMCESRPDSPKPPSGCSMIEITCQSAKDNRTRRLKVPGEGNAKEFDDTVRIEAVKQNYTVIYNEMTNRVSISINNVKGNSKTLLYWPNTQTSRPTYKCVTDVTEGYVASVQYDTNYILCVFDRSDKISLSDCKPFKTERQYSDQVWLTNNKKVEVSIIATFLLLLTLFSGACLTYFLLRYNPSFLRGSKRVITVKSYKKSSVMVMPKGYNSNNQPVHPDPCNDETSSTASYISAIPPGPSEMMEFRFEALRKYAKPYPLPRPS